MTESTMLRSAAIDKLLDIEEICKTAIRYPKQMTDAELAGLILRVIRK